MVPPRLNLTKLSKEAECRRQKERMSGSQKGQSKNHKREWLGSEIISERLVEQTRNYLSIVGTNILGKGKWEVLTEIGNKRGAEQSVLKITTSLKKREEYELAPAKERKRCVLKRPKTEDERKWGETRGSFGPGKLRQNINRN